jgi:predicted GIY-YIG superfamily endonuclease
MESLIIFFNKNVLILIFILIFIPFLINTCLIDQYNNYINNIVNANVPAPLIIINNLHLRKNVLSYRSFLNYKSGVYAFINLINGKRYIGSTINIYRRYLEHNFGRSSNIPLQRAFKNYGKQNFEFVVYAFTTNIRSLINLENQYINYFSFDMLYNSTPVAGSMKGYKHKEETILKLKKRFIKKTDTIKTLNTKLIKKNSSVNLYNNINEYILTFKNNTQLAKFIGCSKSTIGRYIKSGKCYKGLYYFKTN